MTNLEMDKFKWTIKATDSKGLPIVLEYNIESADEARKKAKFYYNQGYNRVRIERMLFVHPCKSDKK